MIRKTFEVGSSLNRLSRAMNVIAVTLLTLGIGKMFA
jgi:hypothetical protein